jgi:hypothetical protein
MDIVKEIEENKEEIIIKILEVLQGKETTARIKLDGLKFHVGDVEVKLNGEVDFTLVPPKPKK